MADIGIGGVGDIASGSVGASDSRGGAEDSRANRRKQNRRNGAKSTLAGPKTSDSLSTPDDPPQPAAEEDAGQRLAKKLRRGRRASILASADNTGLGVTSVSRPGGRAAKTLLG